MLKYESQLSETLVWASHYQYSPIIAIGVVAAIAIVTATKVLLSKRRRLLRQTTKNENLPKMTWVEFEKLTEDIFRSRGYRTHRQGGCGGDGGVDVRLYRKGKQWVVQCKHWNTRKVGVPIVREMLGVMIHQRADGAKIVTSGKFTKECYKFVMGKNIELIDGKKLRELAKIK